MNRSIARVTLGVLALTAASTLAQAGVAPYTEMFAADNANWGGSAGGDWTAFEPLAWSAPGGGPVAGAGFVTYTRNFLDVQPGQFPALTIFRGQDNYNSSGGAFLGNWNEAGITEFSFWVRHDAAENVLFSVRFTPAGGNGPSMNYEFVDDLVQSGVWTKLTLAIDPDTDGWVIGGGPGTYNMVFNNLGKIQIGINPDPLVGIDQDVNFDLSMVSIAVPAPGAIALLTMAGLVGTRRRRSS